MFEERKIKKCIPSIIDSIKCACSFFNISVSVNNNKLNFYDSNNNLLRSANIDYSYYKSKYYNKGKYTFFKDLGILKMEMPNNGKFFITCMGDINSDFVYCVFEQGENSKDLYIIRDRKGNLKEINAVTYKNDYRKSLEVQDNNSRFVRYIVSDYYGDDENRDKQKIRSLTFSNSGITGDITTIALEGKGEHYDFISTKHINDENSSKDIVELMQPGNEKAKEFEVGEELFNSITLKILSHPRSKELISYVEKEIEKDYPGILSIIEDNFDFYNSIKCVEYIPNEKFEEWHSSIVHKECDFDKEDGMKLTRQ